MSKEQPKPPACPHCGGETQHTPFRCQCIGERDACVICRKCDLHMHVPTGVVQVAR